MNEKDSIKNKRKRYEKFDEASLASIWVDLMLVWVIISEKFRGYGKY